MTISKFVTTVAALLVVGASSLSPAAFANDEDFSFYAAVSIVAGAQERIHIDPDLSSTQYMDEFWGINLDLRAQYHGFFIELPGNSQETEDGQYAGPAIGYNFYNSRHWAWDVYFANTAQEVEYRLNGPLQAYHIKRESDERAGLRLSGYFDQMLTQLTLMPNSFSDGISGLEATASARYDWQIRNVNVYIAGGVRYRSSEVWTHFYGLTEADSEQISLVAEGFEQAQRIRDYFVPYQAGSGMALSARVGFEYPLNQRWVVGGFVNVERLPSGAANSPFRDGDNVNVTSLFSLTYVF